MGSRFAWVPPKSDRYWDLPWCYVYDGDALTDGVSYQNLSLPTLGDSGFLLRRIAGLDTIAQSMVLKDPRQKNLSSTAAQFPRESLVSPQMYYPPNSLIYFDLGVVARAAVPNGPPPAIDTYASQLVFQGVRRFEGITPQDSNYDYVESPFTYNFDLTIDWTNRVAPAYITLADLREFTIEMQECDFELHTIRISKQLPGDVWRPADGILKMVLVTAGINDMMNLPVIDGILMENSDHYNGIFPVPPVLYPVRSYIKFRIQSLAVAADIPCLVKIDFHGVRRQVKGAAYR
jgi:hypothetical protein